MCQKWTTSYPAALASNQSRDKAATHGPHFAHNSTPFLPCRSPLLASLGSRLPWMGFKHLYSFIGFLEMEVTTLRGLLSSE